MSKQPPSIFNDVIGPVMRGPSSSHVAGAARIGALVRQAAGEGLFAVDVEFDPNGSLAESHAGHGTDMGFACGILGMSLLDPEVGRYWELIGERGIDLKFRVTEYGASHPNHYRITARSKGRVIHMDAISTGGGMIEVTAFQGFPVSIEGGYYEDCYLTGAAGGEERPGIVNACRENIEAWEDVSFSETSDGVLVVVKSNRAVPEERRKRFGALIGAREEFHFTPVLPTLSSKENKIPFRTAEELLVFNQEKKLPLWKLAALYESERGNTTEDEVLRRMDSLVDIMESAVKTGLEGTVYEDRILHAQAMNMDNRETAARLVPGRVMNTVIQYITAVMEAKSAMSVIVAAPTAGSCGCLPGTVLGVAKVLGKTREEVVRGMLSAGLVGVFFTNGATFAAEVGGCQMECGAGSGMAAAGVAELMGASAGECLDAASVALQGLTGLACDPVANRVEVPCLNKNVVGGMNALSSANMILSGFDKVIPLDETIRAMYDIGLKLPLELRCTFGGLGKTKTSLRIRRALEKRTDAKDLS